MKKIKLISFILFVICLVISVMSFSVYAQPKISKEKIPQNIPSDVRYHIERLYSSNPVDRGRAAYCLGNMGKRAAPAVPFLIGNLHDRSPLQWRDLRGNFGEKTTLREEAEQALRKIIGDFSDVELLIAVLKNENAYVRKYAAEALGNIGDDRAVEPLSAALKDKNSDVRREVAKALGKIGEPAVEPLIAALKDENADVRKYAADVLGEIGGARAFEPLIAALKDENADVRREAVWSLRDIGDTRAVEPLIAVLKDKDSDIREEAADALGEITGQDFGTNQTKWQNWHRRSSYSLWLVICLIILSTGAVLLFKRKK